MTAKLRFCMITTFYPPYNFGGDGVFVHRLSNELARRGHRVDVIHCADAYHLLAGGEPASGTADHSNITVHRLRSPWGALSPLATQQTGYPLLNAGKIREILSAGFDVIHYHNVSLVGGPGILEYGEGIKLYTMHEHWLLCQTHTMFRFNRAACERPHCLVCSLAYGRPPQLWRWTPLLKRAVRSVDAFIAPSRYSEELHTRMGLERPIVHIPHFVPPSQGEASLPDAKGDPDPDGGGPYFLFVGRLEKLKGVQTLIPTFRSYQGARLLVAGTGRYEAVLRRQAAGSRNIVFVGYQSGERLRGLYRRAVAVVVPSLCPEAFGQVVLEAFREGTPVIVRDIGGLPELQRDGGGSVFRTERELLGAMDRLVSDPTERRAQGREAYAAYERDGTVQAHLDRYFALIRQVATARGMSPAASGAGAAS